MFVTVRVAFAAGLRELRVEVDRLVGHRGYVGPQVEVAVVGTGSLVGFDSGIGMYSIEPSGSDGPRKPGSFVLAPTLIATFASR